MKKLILIFIIGLYAFPACAQRGWRRWIPGLRQPTLETFSIKRGVTSAIWRGRFSHKQLLGSYIQFTDLPKQPLVKLGSIQTVNEGVSSLSITPARLLSSDESSRLVFPGPTLLHSIYVPEMLNTKDEVFYRGLHLDNLGSVPLILQKGLERTKTGYSGKIFFSGWLFRVADFAVSFKGKSLPTLVKFTLPPGKDNLYSQNYLFGVDYYLWGEDIPANYIQDVIVFLEVGGKPGWYKVTLENGELVFTLVPSRVFEQKEIIDHTLTISERNKRYTNIFK